MMEGRKKGRGIDRWEEEEKKRKKNIIYNIIMYNICIIIYNGI